MSFRCLDGRECGSEPKWATKLEQLIGPRAAEKDGDWGRFGAGARPKLPYATRSADSTPILHALDFNPDRALTRKSAHLHNFPLALTDGRRIYSLLLAAPQLCTCSGSRTIH